MSILPIVIYGDPVLHKPTEAVTDKPADLAELISDMYETMDRAHGVGLAANQVGVGKRFFVYNCPDIENAGGEYKTDQEIEDQGGPMRRGCVINPVLTTSEDAPERPLTHGTDAEGCLSLPGLDFPTARSDWAEVTGIDENGDPVKISGYGFFARCLQHEVGHLDGYVYTDMLTGKWDRAAKKNIRKNGWDHPGNTWTPGVDKDPFGHDDPE